MQRQACIKIEIGKVKVQSEPLISGIYISINKPVKLDITESLTNGKDVKNLYLITDDCILINSPMSLVGMNLDILETHSIPWSIEYLSYPYKIWKPLVLERDTTQGLTQQGFNKSIRWQNPIDWRSTVIEDSRELGYKLRLRVTNDVGITNLGKYKLSLLGISTETAKGWTMNDMVIEHMVLSIRGRLSRSDIRMALVNAQSKKIYDFHVTYNEGSCQKVTFKDVPVFHDNDDLVLIWISGDTITDIRLALHYLD